jgi:PAS domain S-box-containing protein
MVLFFCVKTLVTLELIESTRITRYTEYFCFLLFIPFFSVIMKNILLRNKNSEKEHNELENFIDNSALISKADDKGKITYVNKKFTEVSGWSLDEVMGKDHNIVNSGLHPKELWTEMYKTTIKDKKIWNHIVTNKAKNGDLYYVDTYIKAGFDVDGKLKGFMSIYASSQVRRVSLVLPGDAR